MPNKMSKSRMNLTKIAGSLILIFTAFSFLIGQTKLVKAYKKGTIILNAEENFGVNTDWNALFYHAFNDLTVGPKGFIYVASSREHAVYKFDQNGNLIRKFGKKGQGPGDFTGPGDVSILDERYIVVGEYATNLRISMFDLEGNFSKLLKTQHSVYSPAALKNNKVAYLSKKSRQREKSSGDFSMWNQVFIKDVETGKEIKVEESMHRSSSIIMPQGGAVTFSDSMGGQLFIAQTADGNLLVGNSLKPKINIYSPEGELINTFPLKLDLIPVTKKYIRRYKDYQIKGMRKNRPLQKIRGQNLADFLEKESFDKLFGKHLPLYKEILVDSEGNILIFKKTDCLGECPILFQVYSPDGEFLTDCTLERGPFDLSIDRRIKNLCFTSDAIYGMFELKDSEEYLLRLYKIKIE